MFAPVPNISGHESKFSNSSAGTVQVAAGMIAWSSLIFAILQSVCTFFAAVDGLRVFFGVTSVVLSASVGATLDRFHADWLRVPMVSLALLGTILNLVILYQVRTLRARPASQWRMTPPSAQKLHKERIQFVLAMATLILVVIEEYQHYQYCHHL